MVVKKFEFLTDNDDNKNESFNLLSNILYNNCQCFC